MNPLATKLPAGVVLGPLAQAVFELLAGYTAFPWPVLSAQCQRAGVAAERLTKAELRQLIPALCTSVGRFTNPEKEAAVRRALTALTARPEHL